MYFAQQRVCKMPAADAKQASRKLHLQKKLRGGLRGDTGATLRIPTPTPHPQRRKINCTLQNARVEKAAWWVAMCHTGLHLKYKSCT